MDEMEKRRTKLKKKAYYTRKIKRATQLLFYKHHKKPGVKGWELRKKLGSDYPKVLKILDNHLEKLDLQIKMSLRRTNLLENQRSNRWTKRDST